MWHIMLDIQAVTFVVIVASMVALAVAVRVAVTVCSTYGGSPSILTSSS